MKKFSRRGGQATIEFVLILPIFAMLLFALIYVGFLFIDVVTLDGAAAAAARSAAMKSGTVNSTLTAKIKSTKLFLYWYKVADDSPKRLVPAYADETERLYNKEHVFWYGVQVELKDSVKDNAVLKMFLPEKFTVTKTTYKE